MLMQGNFMHICAFDSAHLNDPRYYQWITDFEVVRYIGRDELLDGIPFPEVEQYVRQLWDSPFCSFLAVYHTESNIFIVTAKVNFISERGRRHGLVDIGIMLGNRDFLGKGLVTDVLRVASNYAFDVLGARKLTAGAVAPNAAVVKAFLRIGYVEEGRLRHQDALDGGYCDHILLGCFKDELIDA